MCVLRRCGGVVYAEVPKCKVTLCCTLKAFFLDCSLSQLLHVVLVTVKQARLSLTCSKLLHTHTRRRGRRSFDYVTCCISFKPNSRPIKGYPWNSVISRARQRLREAEQGEVCFSHHNYGLDAGWGDSFMKLQQVTCLSFTSHCSPKCSILTHSSSLLPVLRTSTSRTSHPVGVMGWLSVPWFTPSFPPSLTTPLCHQPIAGTTLSWPLELQSEW